jgi:four helix bundle protein
MAPYERFKAWQVSHRLALEVFRLTDCWPIKERYGLSAQARRAAFSVAANIAEGSSKRGRAEFGRFLDISLGSLGELGYTLRFAHDCGILRVEDWNRLDALRDHAGKLLWGLYRSVRVSR